MTNDVLEQIAEDYFRELGYFTQHNVKYLPNGKGVHSDIDVIAIHPIKTGVSKVCVISCKSDQTGMSIDSVLKNILNDPTKKIRSRSMEKRYREIAHKNSASELIKKVKEITGEDIFTFYLCVTKYSGNSLSWQDFTLFKENLPSCEIKILTIKEMVTEIQKRLTTTPSYSAFTRTLQLIEAAKGKVDFKN